VSIPGQHRAGDTLEWIEAAAGAVSSADGWALNVYLRKAAAGITAVGAARTDGGWDLTLTATTTAAMGTGEGQWQAVASKDAASTTLDAGRLQILPSLVYSDTPAAFDGRSEAEIELAEVRAAIRALITKGAQQYTIGSRSFSALDLGKLTERESQLRAIVAREKAAARVAAGLGDPRNVFVRFG
jgi:hypothetical protein